MKSHTPSRWLRILIPSILILVWLAVGGIGGPIFGKLSEVSTNDQASFLPVSAESTKVQKLQSEFATSNSVPAIVIIESQQTITPSQMGELQSVKSTIQSVDGVGSSPGTVIGPIPSQDGRAVEFIIALPEGADINQIVGDMRTALKTGLPDGMTVYVTGPAGLVADLVGAFAGIDGLLLYVTLAAVFVILLLVYRSLILPFLVLITALFALTAAGAAVYFGVSNGLFKLNGQSQGILSILVIGAATDYSLLLIARYREALEHHESKWEAISLALKASFEPIAASAATVILALLCLLFSDLNSNRSLGPVGALGIAFSFIAAMTLLPALLTVFGRVAFWPFRPKYTPLNKRTKIKTGLEDRSGIWRKIPLVVSRHARPIWVICLVLLGVAILNVPNFNTSGVSTKDTIIGESDAVKGLDVQAKHFPAGTGSPILIIAAASSQADVQIAAAKMPAVESTQVVLGPNGLPLVVNDKVMVKATLNVNAESQAAEDTVTKLRDELASIDSGALVGGVSAVALDSNNTARADLHKIIPIVLVVILLILILLLRSLAAPLVLIISVILSYSATLGVAAFFFNHVFDFPGAEPSMPLFGFIFLVALGVDYNIFLMTRVREESKKIGTRPGILRGLSVTGGVITSAGVVLATTFAALAVVPVLFLAQIAFIVAFGVLLDTLLVRTLLVPAFAYDIDKRIWWPSKLWRTPK